MLDAGADVVRLNAAHGAADVHAERAALARDDRGRARPRGRRARRPARPEDADRARRRRRDRARDRAAASRSPSAPVVGDDAPRVDDGARARAVGRARRRHVPRRRRDRAARRTQIDGDDVVCRGRAGRHRCVRARACTCRAPKRTSSRSPRPTPPRSTMAIAIKADFVGLSFVRRPEDVEARARAAAQARASGRMLVAKIETAVALDHLAGIVGAADAVMVARGDLGIQVPARRVPLIQKEIIRFCNMAGKPVITATQMLESMTRVAAADARRGERRRQRGARRHRRARCCRRRPRSASTRPTRCARWARSRRRRRRGRGPRTTPAGAAAAPTTTGSRGPSRTRRCRRPKTSGSPRSSARRRAARPRAGSPRSARRCPIVGISAQAGGARPARASCGACGRSPVPHAETATTRLTPRGAQAATRLRARAQSGDLVAVVSASPGKRAGSTDTVRIVRA